MSAPQYKDSLVNDILALADTLFRELLPSVPRELLAMDITMPQMKILLVLYVCGPRRMSAIASELDVTLSTATSLVDRLVEKGYVLREAHPDDRRVVLCHLSEAGQQAIGLIWQTARSRSRELLLAMDTPRLEMFIEALRAMREVALGESLATAEQ